MKLKKNGFQLQNQVKESLRAISWRQLTQGDVVSLQDWDRGRKSLVLFARGGAHAQSTRQGQRGRQGGFFRGGLVSSARMVRNRQGLPQVVAGAHIRKKKARERDSYSIPGGGTEDGSLMSLAWL